MTIQDATIVFDLLIPEYHSIREESTSYKAFKDDKVRDSCTQCAIYSSKLKNSAGEEGAWLFGDTWEILIQFYLEKKQEQDYNGKQ